MRLMLFAIFALLASCAKPLAGVPASVRVVGAEQAAVDEAPKPLSIIVTPETTVPSGLDVTYTATGLYPYGQTRDLTAAVLWQSSDTAVAAFTDAASPSRATSGALGSATVTATYKDVAGSAALQVKDASLKVVRIIPGDTKVTLNPTLDAVPAMKAYDFQALGIYSDGSLNDITAEVVWSTDDAAVAAFDETIPGTARCIGAGKTTVSAAYKGLVGQVALTVDVAPVSLISISTDIETLVLPIGTTHSLVVTGTYLNGETTVLTDGVTWTSDRPQFATVSNESGTLGLVTPVAGGEAHLTVSVGSVSKTIVVAVTTASIISLEIQQKDLSVPLGGTLDFTVSGTFSDGSVLDLTSAATWTALTPPLLTMGDDTAHPNRGKANAPGAAKIAAGFKGVETKASILVTNAAIVTLRIEPPEISLAKGRRTSLKAFGILSDGTEQEVTATVSWGASNTLIGTVDNAAFKGVAVGVGVGSTLARATLGTVTQTAKFVVLPAVATALSVSANLMNAPLGLSRQFHAIATFSDGTTSDVTQTAAWSFNFLSAGYSLAAYVQNNEGGKGLVKTLALGTTGITAVYQGITMTADFTVTEKAIVSLSLIGPANLLEPGDTVQLAATALYTDNSTRNVTALSGDPDLSILFSTTGTNPEGSILSIDTTTQIGLVTAEHEGPATVFANLTSGKFGVFNAFFNISVRSHCTAGIRSGFYCYSLGAFGQDCNAVCSAGGGAYHQATRYVTGSDNLIADGCRDALRSIDLLLYATLENGGATEANGLGLGCGILNFLSEDITVRYTSPVTTAAAFDPAFRRVCACTQ